SARCGKTERSLFRARLRAAEPVKLSAGLPLNKRLPVVDDADGWPLHGDRAAIGERRPPRGDLVEVGSCWCWFTSLPPAEVFPDHTLSFGNGVAIGGYYRPPRASSLP